MEVIEMPKHQCEKCGCVYTFGSNDFKEENYYVGHNEVSYQTYLEVYKHDVYVECPACGNKHVISTKLDKKIMKLRERSYKKCDTCKHRGTMQCPPSIECYAMESKPHFEPKEDGWICRLRDMFKKRRADRRWAELLRSVNRFQEGCPGYGGKIVITPRFTFKNIDDYPTLNICGHIKLMHTHATGERCEVCGSYLKRDDHGELRCFACNPPQSKHGFEVGDAVRWI